MHMKWLISGCVVAMAAAMPAAAQQAQYSAVLTGAAESPPSGSPGSGSALVTVDLGLSTMRVETSFSGLSGTTTASHIHCCTAVAGAGNVGVATQTPFFVDFPIGVTAGSYDRTFDMTSATSFNAAFLTANAGSPASAFATLLAGFDAGTAYFNIHSSLFPGGEIRGFLVPAVPEPSTYALLGLGLGAVAWAARRRRAA